LNDDKSMSVGMELILSILSLIAVVGGIMLAAYVEEKIEDANRFEAE